MSLQIKQNTNYVFTCSLCFVKIYLNIIKPHAFFFFLYTQAPFLQHHHFADITTAFPASGA